MEASLTHEAFTGELDTNFQVQTEDGTVVQLKLIDVSELKVYPQQEEFTIVLRGPLDAFLGQGTRPLTHGKMGEFELFMVPIRQDEQGFYYEAVFNRIREQAG